jgi:hypothetical protein
MAVACLGATAVSCAHQPEPQPPPGAVTFNVEGEPAKVYWDLVTTAAGEKRLSVAINAGQYPAVPDTMIDLKCRGGELRVSSLRMRYGADVPSGRNVPRQIVLIAGALRLTGPTDWGSNGYERMLNTLRLRPSPAELRQLLTGRLCLFAVFDDGSEGGHCYVAPPQALAERFEETCALGGDPQADGL